MIVFSDTDILIKLAALDLLEEALGVLDTTHDDVYVLKREELKLSSKEIIREYGKAASNRAVQFALKAPKIDKVDPAEYVKLQAVVDAGEATLFAATASEDFDLLITSDRRALRKLVESADCKDAVSRISGKVVCLEQILLDIIGTAGFERVRTSVMKSDIPDFALVKIFRDRSHASRDDVCKRLKERIALIARESGALLAEHFGQC